MFIQAPGVSRNDRSKPAYCLAGQVFACDGQVAQVAKQRQRNLSALQQIVRNALDVSRCDLVQVGHNLIDTGEATVVHLLAGQV